MSLSPVIETLDVSDFPSSASGSPPVVVFVAAFARQENEEAARWLIDMIVPRIRESIPGIKIRFAGSHPPTWLANSKAAGFEVTGYLKNMSDAYRDASCVIVPLRRGAGLKFKTIQAMSLGVPVVSTTIGAEGILELCGFEPFAVEDDAERFADAILDAVSISERQVRDLRRQAHSIRGAVNLKLKVEEQVSRMTALHSSRSHT
ncbi:glycosyltransferase family 4 protein [Aeromicrobium sp. UC242_57]|uniref:glycosyltransferase family 4 protein n=1 Tax=Aeromicrobium sp. UC242_57 TaxID=3374624 RepID=UPI0037BC6A05